MVGPNEAGKSSILDALAHLNNAEKFAPTELSRHSSPASEDYVVEAVFLLERPEIDALADIPEAVGLSKISFVKRADGGLRLRWWSTVPERDASSRTSIEATLRRAVNSPFIRGRTYSSGALISDWLDELAEFLASAGPELDAAEVDRITKAGEHIASLSEESAPAYFRSLPEQFANLAADASRPEPRQEVASRLFKMRPRFVRFDESARELPSSFDLANLASGAPTALANLARLADLDLEALARAITEARPGEVQEMQEGANARLDAAFAGAWTQGDVTVSLNVEGTDLQFYVREDGGTFWDVGDRSDGLRWFVALIALLNSERHIAPPILLVDEAEQHLHYDAQADLIRTFQSQSEAAGIIYTTHSAGCLPQDLGSGVKVVKRIGRHTSTILNGFWVTDTGGPDEAGFSPVLMAMGATTFAFSAARFAVICEGRTELILLPTLVRQAMQWDSMPFQIVPGLSSISPYAVPALDLAAARVVFLTDGDSAGRAIARKLRRAGVPEDRILALGEGEPDLSLEDFVDAASHRAAVGTAMATSDTASIPPVTLFSGPGRATRLDEWHRRVTNSNRKLDKVAVAHNLVAMARAGDNVVSRGRTKEIGALIAALTERLGFEG